MLVVHIEADRYNIPILRVVEDLVLYLCGQRATVVDSKTAAIVMVMP